jgi:hypothetical protein
LVQLTAVRGGPRTPGIEQFALIFRGPIDCPPEGALYRASGALGAAFPLFAVPAGEDAGEPLVRADCTRVL